MTKNDESLELVKQAIRGRWLRATPARIAALHLLRRLPSPLTRSEVTERLAGSGVDRVTVFRNLNDLVEAGLLCGAELGDHVWRFEAIDLNSGHGSAHPPLLTGN